MSTKRIYYYIYRINFSDGTYYIGARKSKVQPNFDVSYFGSPITHKEKWNNPDLIKEKVIIKSGFKSFETLRKYETKLIRTAWKTDKSNNLNENCGGYFSEQACKLGGKVAGEKCKALGLGIHSQTLDEKRQLGLDSVKNKTGAFGLTENEKYLRSKKAFENGLKNLSKKELSDNGKKGREKWVEAHCTKDIEIKDPVGNLYVTRVMYRFCLEFKLNDTSMYKVLNGKKKSYKGWTARYL